MSTENLIRAALEQGLQRFTGRLNTEEARKDVAALLERYAEAATPSLTVDFSADTARVSNRTLQGTITVYHPSESETLVAWANAGLLVEPESLGLALREVDGKAVWRWPGSKDSK